jgi:branched-chain amino acid:cation transporter, LIVCS family
MKNKFLVLSVGFALFSMFFGSGNLVFPLLVGKESGGHFLLGFMGIFLTGVAVPFLGILGMLLFKGATNEFFSSLGRVGTFLFSFIALSLMGPFGVLARCLTVAHGAVQTAVPNASLWVTSAILCVITYGLTVRKNKIVSLLGSILTPLLLLSIALIVVFAFKDGSLTSISTTAYGRWDAFKNGFFQGYQTMDLLASVFFSTFVIQHLQTARAKADQIGDVCEKTSLKVFARSALVGAGILSAVYFALVGLGSANAAGLANINPQEMLGFIAIKTLGTMGAPCLCVVVVLACLTTAIVLASLFADFLKKEICQDKIGFKTSLFITMAIGFVISTIGFSGIAGFLGPIVEVIYPALIMLTVINIIHKFWGVKKSHWPITITLAARLMLSFGI